MGTITVRQKIMAQIERRGAASAAQIGRSLSMSAAAVRHHLTVLVADGRIELERVEARGKRGRPEKIYRLSERVLGDNLALLSEVMLRIWQDGLPAAKREADLRQMGERLSVEVGIIEQNLPGSKRLEQLTEKLNGMHYQARWEAGAQGPRILLGHCPYAAIIEKHPELCAMDAAFLGAEMSAPVEQRSKIDHRPGGATHCIFNVR